MDITELTSLLDNPPHAYGEPPVTAVIRRAPEDFIVEEILPFVPCGEGEHVYLRIRKRNTNTPWLARRLAKFAGVAPRDIGYAGLKDRHALTTQWFSVYLPRAAPIDWYAFSSDDWGVTEVARHKAKLRRGAIAANRFQITLRDLATDTVEVLRQRHELVEKHGVPNYFGEQRFGHDNLATAQKWVLGAYRPKGAEERGLLLSTLRAALFNGVLAHRVADGSWHSLVAGEAVMLNGSRSFFVAEAIDEALVARCNARDILPSGPLYGDGELPTRGAALDYERCWLDEFAPWIDHLRRARLSQERRSLVAYCSDLEVRELSSESAALVSFSLPAGSYATSVLRELVNYSDVSRQSGGNAGEQA